MSNYIQRKRNIKLIVFLAALLTIVIILICLWTSTITAEALLSNETVLDNTKSVSNILTNNRL